MDNLFVRIFDSIGAKILFPALPSIWFTFFAVFGSSNETLMVQNRLTMLGLVSNLIMLSLIVFYVCASIYCQSVQRKQKVLKEKIYTSILQNIDDANIFIRNKQINALFDPTTASCCSDYQSSVNVLLMMLVKCFSETIQIDKSKFVASYFYKTENDEWKIINSDGKHKGLDIRILSDPSTVFAQLYPEDSTIFYPSKEDASKEGKYLTDKRDAEQKDIFNCPMGSIFGSNWSISEQTSDKILFSSIITVATYGEEICSKKDVFTKKVIIEQILKAFENQFLLLAYDFIDNRESVAKPHEKPKCRSDTNE